MRFPGPKAKRILRLNKEYYATNTAGARICVEKGEGATLTDYDGYRFIDLHCDAGVNNLGRNHQAIMRAMADQMNTGIIMTEHHNAPNEYAVKLAKFLDTKSPVPKPAKAFLSNSGAEANENAIKLCRSYRHQNEEAKKRTLAIYFKNGFAGRTKGVLPATSSKPEVQRDPFWDECDRRNTIYLPYPKRWVDWSGLKDEFDRINLDYVDRILIEVPCQGEGGIIPVDEDALKYIYEKSQAAGVFFISDCIQTGIGRVGALFGCDVFPWLKPDILTMAKALGGGFPIGATIFRKDLDPLPCEISNTFGGGQLIARVALTVVDEVAELLASGAVQKIEGVLDERLRRLLTHKLVVDIRGLGAMWAVELKTPKLRDRLIEIGEESVLTQAFGLRLLSAGNRAVRIMPPLVIKEEELNVAMDLFEKALEALG